MHRLEAEYWGRVDFLYFDREKPANADVVDRFGIIYQPVFILLDENNNEVARWFTGSETSIRQQLDAYLAGR